MRTRFLLFLAAALVLLSGCDKTKTKSRSGDFLLPVMETTDIHGYIVSREDDFFHYRMAYIADKAKDIRGRGAEYAKDRLLLLDGGDLYQGASISNLLGGQPVSAAVDRMEYDAVALGNHEFDWGIESTVDPDATMPDYEWAGSRQVNDIPVLCANLYLDGSRAPFTKDYVIVEKTARSSSGETVPVRIGIIGFAVDYASSIMSSKFTDRGFSIREDYSIADDRASATPRSCSSTAPPTTWRPSWPGTAPSTWCWAATATRARAAGGAPAPCSCKGAGIASIIPAPTSSSCGTARRAKSPSPPW